MFLLSILFHSVWSIGITALVLLIAAGFAFLRGWTTLAIVLAGFAAANIYSGVIYRTATAACEERVRTEVQAERERQDRVFDSAIADLNTRLGTSLAIEEAAAVRLKEYEAELAGRPPGTACPLSDADVKALNNGR